MTDEFDDRFDEPERERFEDLEGTMRLQERPQALFLNCGTGDAISPSGSIPDHEVVAFEEFHRERLLVGQILSNAEEIVTTPPPAA